MYAEGEAVKKTQFRRKKIKVGIGISDASIRHDSTFVPLAKHGIPVCVNRRFMIFVPEKSEVTLTFSADAETDVSAIALNYVAIRPFYEEDPAE